MKSGDKVANPPPKKHWTHYSHKGPDALKPSGKHLVPGLCRSFWFLDMSFLCSYANKPAAVLHIKFGSVTEVSYRGRHRKLRVLSWGRWGGLRFADSLQGSGGYEDEREAQTCMWMLSD